MHLGCLDAYFSKELLWRFFCSAGLIFGVYGKTHLTSSSISRGRLIASLAFSGGMEKNKAMLVLAMTAKLLD